MDKCDTEVSSALYGTFKWKTVMPNTKIEHDEALAADLEKIKIAAAGQRFNQQLFASLDARRRAMILAYLTKETTESIASCFNCDASTVSRTAKRCGFPYRGRLSKAKDVVAAYEAGIPLVEISKEFGITSQGCNSIARRHGLKARITISKISDAEIDVLIAKRKELRLTQEDLADKIGVMKVTLGNWERKFKLPTKFNLACWKQALGM